MDTNKRLLVAVDDGPASERAVRYVGRVLDGTQGFTVVLLYMLGPLPPQLRESPGAKLVEGEEKLEQNLVAKQKQEVRKSARHALPLLEKAQGILTSAGVPAEAVERECPVLFNGEDLVREMLREARDRHCATVVVGRQSFGGLKEIFTGHLADDLLREGEGFAFWVVE